MLGEVVHLITVRIDWQVGWGLTISLSITKSSLLRWVNHLKEDADQISTQASSSGTVEESGFELTASTDAMLLEELMT